MTVTPGDGLPLAHDLIWMGEAYAVKPERMSAYGLTPPASEADLGNVR